MKIQLHQRIQLLSEAFHKGELSLTDYRELRRKEFDLLNSATNEHTKKGTEGKGLLAKRALLATLVSVGLLLVTVILAKFLL